MKTSFVNNSVVLAGAAICLAFSPVLWAQSSTSGSAADAPQNSKAADAIPQNQSGTTGNPASQPGTLQNHDSKDNTISLDKNPSIAPTDSAQTSGTKDPNPAQPGQMSSNGGASDKTSPGKTSDQDFIQKAAQGGMTEVELGKLAQEKGSSAEVKQFGSHMVMDHSKANAELLSIANKKGIDVPSTLDAKHQAMVDRFQHLSGAAFDRSYVHAMVRDHEKDATEFREASTSAQDPDVKTFAGNTLKVIESHLSDIKSIQSNMK